MSSLARIRNSGSLLQSNACNLFFPWIYPLSVLSGCPLERGVRKVRVDCIDKFTSYFKTSFNGKFHPESRSIFSCGIMLYAICQMFQFIEVF